MVIGNNWRNDNVFQAILVSQNFLNDFNSKMFKASIKSKVALFRFLLNGWIDGKYKLPKNQPVSVNSGGVGLSVYYPKSIDQSLIDRMSKEGLTSKASVFRSILYGWTYGDIKATMKKETRILVSCRSVGAALSVVDNSEFRKKAAKQGLSRSAAISKLLEKWASTGICIKIGNSDSQGHSKDHCFGIVLPSRIDDMVKNKMSKSKITNKRVVIRKLVDMYLKESILI
jgi:hypothetical protein